MYFSDWWKSSTPEERMERLTISKDLASERYEDLGEGIRVLLVVAYRAGE